MTKAIASKDRAHTPKHERRRGSDTNPDSAEAKFVQLERELMQKLALLLDERPDDIHVWDGIYVCNYHLACFVY